MERSAVAVAEPRAVSIEERRRTHRRDETVPVTVATTGRQVISGETVNFSHGGVLLRSDARIAVIVTLNGKRYEGRLVRAIARETGTSEYDIELERLLDFAASGG